jgi:AcrR family transcriptional regulator
VPVSGNERYHIGVTGVYGGVSARERQAARRERLLHAAYDLLGTDGWQATTVRAVCRRAGLTPRYFYESFRELDGLVVAVFDEIVAELVEVVLGAVAAAPDDAHAKARAAIGGFIKHVTADPRRAQIVFSEALGSEALARRRFETLHSFARLIAEQGRAFYGIRGHDRLADTTAYMLAGGLAELLLAWRDGTIQSSVEELIDDCTMLFVATGEAAVGMVTGSR